MATHNSLFQDADVRRHPEGIAVSVQLPWYRSLWLSAVDDVAATVNGVEIPKESLRFELQGKSYSIAELPGAVGNPVVRRGQARGDHPAGPRPRRRRGDRRRGHPHPPPALHADRAACATWATGWRSSGRWCSHDNPARGHDRPRLHGCRPLPGLADGAAGVRSAGRTGNGGHCGPERRSRRRRRRASGAGPSQPRTGGK